MLIADNFVTHQPIAQADMEALEIFVSQASGPNSNCLRKPTN